MLFQHLIAHKSMVLRLIVGFINFQAAPFDLVFDCLFLFVVLYDVSPALYLVGSPFWDFIIKVKPGIVPFLSKTVTSSSLELAKI